MGEIEREKRKDDEDGSADEDDLEKYRLGGEDGLQVEEEKAEEPGQQASRPSQVGRDGGEFGSDFVEHIRKGGFRF